MKIVSEWFGHMSHAPPNKIFGSTQGWKKKHQRVRRTLELMLVRPMVHRAQNFEMFQDYWIAIWTIASQVRISFMSIWRTSVDGTSVMKIPGLGDRRFHSAHVLLSALQVFVYGLNPKPKHPCLATASRALFCNKLIEGDLRVCFEVERVNRSCS